MRELPRDYEAERQVLACCIHGKADFIEAHAILGDDETVFFEDQHQRLWSRMVALSNEERDITMEGIIGGQTPGYIASETWAALSQVSSAAGGDLKHRAGIVLDFATRRRLIIDCQQIIADASKHEAKAGPIIARLEERTASHALKLGETKTTLMKGNINKALETIKSRLLKGIATHWPQLDRILGGLYPGDLYIIAGRPGTGKSAFACNLAVRMQKKQRRVYFLSLEMGCEQLMGRMVCILGNVTRDALLAGNVWGQLDEDAKAGVELADRCEIEFDDSSNSTWSSIRARCKRAVARGAECIIIDYLQLMSDETADANRAQEVGRISRGLKIMARQCDIPIVALCQLNRTGEEGSRPTPAQLRESGSLEQDADTVILLSRPDGKKEEPITICVDVAKQRDGATGEVFMKFNRATQRFYE